MRPALRTLAIGLAALFQTFSSAQAGVFDLPVFAEPGQWAVGLEPEIQLSSPTGAGLNLKPKYGLNNLLNLQGMIGLGAGGRKFRVGATADFEWFPDYDKQPGIATPAFFEYYRLKNNGQVIVGLKPMVFKTFVGEQAEYTPFVALPIGWEIQNSETRGFVQVALGSNFKLPGLDPWRFTVEAGFNVSNAYSYLSGGVTYYHSP